MAGDVPERCAFPDTWVLTAMPILKKRLALAIALGLVAQACLLAFGLHAGLGIAEICGASLACFWLLNGVYFVLGFAGSLLFVPWARLRVRLATFMVIVAAGLALGAFSTP